MPGRRGERDNPAGRCTGGGDKQRDRASIGPLLRAIVESRHVPLSAPSFLVRRGSPPRGAAAAPAAREEGKAKKKRRSMPIVRKFHPWLFLGGLLADEDYLRQRLSRCAVGRELLWSRDGQS